MYLGKAFDCLQLHNETIGNEQIQSGVAHAMPLGIDGDDRLSDEGNPARPELDAERFLVDPLEEPWPEAAMDFDGRAEHGSSEIIQLRGRLSKSPSVGLRSMHAPNIGRRSARVARATTTPTLLGVPWRPGG